ncbi:hypothetical protein [Brevundimonas abyssalis]|uniref:Uncharacterized protein n=1 Tax=Brevundimonas abyssalis TAR-001 TaxID=1391729 RepID=A0A8E0NAY2_9CAUL|nr:hypothetical protein [Brevundimonas abyssalis]GAD58693.1 hypothetical protein MBEBAB_0943 [Brevundimonas abyssalis TAR-001]
MIGVMAALAVMGAQPAPMGGACVQSLWHRYGERRVAELCAGVNSNLCYGTAAQYMTFERAADVCRHVQGEACFRAAATYYTLQRSADLCRHVHEPASWRPIATRRWTARRSGAGWPRRGEARGTPDRARD